MTLLFKRALAVAGFAIALLAVSPASAQDYVRFASETAKCQLAPGAEYSEDAVAALNNETGAIGVGVAEPGSRSAHWLMKPVGNPAAHTFELQNRATGELLVSYPTSQTTLEVAVLAADAQVPAPFIRERNTRPLSAEDTTWTIIEQPKPKARPDLPTTVLISKINVLEPSADSPGRARYLGATQECKLALDQRAAWRLDNLGPATPPKEPDYVWLRRAGTTLAVHIETGAPQLSALGSPGWWSAQWEMKQVSSTALARPGVFFINRWTKKALARSGEGLTLVDPPASFSDLSNSAALWNVVGGAQAGVALQNGDRFLALSGAAGKLAMSKQDSNWLIEYSAPGAPAPVAAPLPEKIVQVLVGSGFVLNVERGPVAIDPDKPGDPNPPSHWWSGMWVVVELGVDNPDNPRTQFFALRNRHTHKYLAVVDRQIVMVDERPNVPKEQLSYAWKMPIVASAADYRPLQNVMSNAYLDANAREGRNVGSLKLSDQPAAIWSLKRLD